MEKQKNNALQFDWQTVLRYGLIMGVVLLYVGMIGMLASFSERDIIRDTLTLAQVVLFAPAFLGGYLISRKYSNNPAIALASAVGVGALTAIPTLMMLGISQTTNVQDILVNISRDWVDVITLNNRDNLLMGSAYLFGALAVSGIVGAVMSFIPDKIRAALIFGLSFTFLVGTMGATVSQVIEQIFGDDVVDLIFRRDSLLVTPAIVIFVLATAVGFLRVFMGKNVEKTYSELPAVQKTMAQRIGYIALLAFLLILPFAIGRALSDIAVLVGLYILMGFGLNIAIGMAGLLDLGYVTNFAVGAYIAAVMTSTGPLGRLEGVTFWMVIPVAILAAMFAGFIFAVPVLKMRGDYLAIATLGFGEIIGRLALSDWFAPVIGGAQGVLAVPKPVFFGLELRNPEQLYYLVLVACLLTLFVSIRLNNSRTGRQWMAIREDEDVAAAMGIDTARAKLLAFTISAATGGLAGAIFAAKVGTVFPNSFLVFVSINVLSLIIVGGMGSNTGIVLGALVLVGLPELLREFTEYRWLMYGVLLIFMMLNRPEGLLPSKVTQRELETQQELKAAAGD